MADVMLEEAFVASTGRTYRITMGEASPKGEDIAFTYSAAPNDGGKVFIFEAVVTKVLMEKLGFNKADAEHLKKIRKITAFKGLEDLAKRLNGGHDENFDNLPYIKMFTLRDKPSFEKFM